MTRDPTHIRFLTNHAYVILAIAESSQRTVRQVAQRVGITERATYTLLHELEAAGYLSRRHDGQKPTIAPILDRPLIHPLLEDRTLADLTGLVRHRTAE